jgi:hypothetical protein
LGCANGGHRSKVTSVAVSRPSAILPKQNIRGIERRNAMKLLRLCSGGRLIYDYGWQREPEDVTERGHKFLFEPLVVQSSFKVRDVLALMRACPELQEIYGRIRSNAIFDVLASIKT